MCGECNQAFGNGLDREFLRNSFVALDRLINPEFKAGEGPGPQFAQCEHGYLDLRVLNAPVVQVPAQLAHVGGDLLLVAAFDPRRSSAESIVAKFRAMADRRTVRIRDVPEHEPPRLVLGRDGRTCLLRASTVTAADALFSALNRDAACIRHWRPELKPASLKVSMDFNVPGRCAAKMAFNMAGELLGAQALVDEAFSPIRAYILGNDVISGPATAANGEEGVRFDDRFVNRWPWERPEGRTIAQWHRIVLESSGGLLCGRISLWGGLHEYRVRLGPARSAMPEIPASFWSRPGDDWWVLPGRGPMRHGVRASQAALP